MEGSGAWPSGSPYSRQMSSSPERRWLSLAGPGPHSSKPSSTSSKPKVKPVADPGGGAMVHTCKPRSTWRIFREEDENVQGVCVQKNPMNYDHSHSATMTSMIIFTQEVHGHTPQLPLLTT